MKLVLKKIPQVGSRAIRGRVGNLEASGRDGRIGFLRIRRRHKSRAEKRRLVFLQLLGDCLWGELRGRRVHRHPLDPE